MNDLPSISREVNLDTTIVFVDGITRTGKSMMGPILASFERMEIERMEEIFEHIGGLDRMNKISRDASVALLKTVIDAHLYNGMIGRNTNFRFSDHSSVWRNPNRLRHFKRIFAPDGAKAVQRIILERPIYQNQTHDQLANFKLFHEAFSDRFRVLEMIRHPVDVVDSWMRREWGSRFGSDPLAFTFCIRYEEEDLPYYALGWEESYLAANPMGRVVGMISRLWDESRSVYQGLPADQKDQVLIIPFEDFVQRPKPYLGPIGDFLGSKPTRHTSSALRRQNCPRTDPGESRQLKSQRIENEAAPEDRKTMERLAEEYENLAAATTQRDA